MYTDYFGFREKPFSITPNPRFFYTNPVYQEAYASLLYGILERKGFIVLTGEVGTGKTTLLRKLMNNLEVTVRFAFLYNTSLTFDEFLTATCEDLGLPVAGAGCLQRIQALNEFLIEQLRRGGTSVLLIDEAQNLKEEVLENLRLLSNLETANEKLLQIVLVGQPELEIKLDQPKLRQLKQRIALQCRLDRLKDWEVGPFIHYRLQAVGYKSQDLFTPEAIQRIALYSSGIPRLINIICDNALLIAYGTSQKTVSASTIEEVAHDLRLKKEEIRAARAEALPAKRASENGDEKEAKTVHDEPLQPKRRRLAWLGIFLVLLLLSGGGAAVSPWYTGDRLSIMSLKVEDLISTLKQLPEFFKHHLNVWLTTPMNVWLTTPDPTETELEKPQVPPSRSEPQPELRTKPHGPGFLQPEVAKETLETKRDSPSEVSSPPPTSSAAGEWRDRPLVIQQGTTISEIVLKVYGYYNALAFDLIKEFNPHIEDLDWVIAGEKLWLPPFTQETLLRKQPEGSYRLILASFGNLLEAQQFAQVARSKEYIVVITPRQVSDSLLLYQVAIGELQNLAAANRAWANTLANRWLPFEELQ